MPDEPVLTYDKVDLRWTHDAARLVSEMIPTAPSPVPLDVGTIVGAGYRMAEIAAAIAKASAQAPIADSMRGHEIYELAVPPRDVLWYLAEYFDNMAAAAPKQPTRPGVLDTLITGDDLAEGFTRSALALRRAAQVIADSLPKPREDRRLTIATPSRDEGA